MPNNNIAVVFTHKSVDKMLEHGGSQSWVIGRNALDKIGYVVCTRNTDAPDDDDHGERPEARNAAFLVGKVSGMQFVTNRNDRDRYLILFSKYAIVSIPDFRTGTTRNPVTYSTPYQCLEKGIDIDNLDWIEMPKKELPGGKIDIRSEQGLTLSEARNGLSIYFGVPPENIQISITG